MVVEMCKNIPTANANIILLFSIKGKKSLEAKNKPIGADNAKTEIEIKKTTLDRSLASISVLNTMAIGILWIIMPNNKEVL